jgi:hypothetical protein
MKNIDLVKNTVYSFRSVGRAINVLNNLIKRDMESCNTNEIITGMQGVILHFIVNCKTDVYSKDIEVEFGMRRATVCDHLILLEQSGMIVRKDFSEDKRLKKIVPTDKAKTAIFEIEKNIKRNECQLAQGLTKEEIAEFLRIASIMAKNMDK